VTNERQSVKLKSLSSNFSSISSPTSSSSAVGGLLTLIAVYGESAIGSWLLVAASI